MSLLQHAPAFENAAAERLALELYGLHVRASPLPGERDQNFLLTPREGPGERLVLKIANRADAQPLLEAQNEMMARVAPLGLTPRVVANAAGEVISPGPGGHFIRVLTWVPGVPLGTIRPPSDDLLLDLGRAVGSLHQRLEGFDHPALHRDFHWDLAQAFRVVREHAPRIAAEPLRGLVERTAAHVDARDAGVLARLRRSAVHGDPNDQNVIVQGPGPAGGDDAPRPGVCRIGLVDFGDAVVSYTVADLAIAIAYAVLDADDPLRVAALIVRGHHERYPILDDEVRALFALVQLRLCASVCVAAWQHPQRPADEYLLISQDPIRRTLPRLAAIHPDAAEERLREACLAEPAYQRGALRPEAVLADRLRRTGANIRVSYRRPLHPVRGWMQYLYDEHGRQYLDGYNNVPHVGHSHPRIAAAVAAQLRTLNTNTRYLQVSLGELAERIAATLPDPLRICYFVNSGSEANELALRLARAHTRRRDLIVQAAAYHGHTTTLIDISPYKFDGPGGEGRPSWVHVAPLPDDYRGEYRRDDPDAGAGFARAVAGIIDTLHDRGVAPCAFIAESCPSVGGQIVPPPGYLASVYRAVRGAGGVCIADEVQTAYGRLGTHSYAFETQHVVPDIVVLGKPIGNGYPLGAVVTTPEIARSFDNGMEFFSTFGGSTAACVAGLAVLDVMQEERLQAHALRVGERLLAGLRTLAARFPVVGDVRGSGLFVGVDLVEDRGTRQPAAAAASAVVNRMRDDGVLIGTDGAFHNVLKIRPPMPFDDHDADRLVATLEAALASVARSS